MGTVTMTGDGFEGAFRVVFLDLVDSEDSYRAMMCYVLAGVGK